MHLNFKPFPFNMTLPYHYYYNTCPRSINFSCSKHLKEFSYCSFIPREVSLPSPCHASAKIILHEIRESYNTRTYNMIDVLTFILLSKFSCAKSIKFELAMVSVLFTLFKNEYLWCCQILNTLYRVVVNYIIGGLVVWQRYIYIYILVSIFVACIFITLFSMGF